MEESLLGFMVGLSLRLSVDKRLGLAEGSGLGMPVGSSVGILLGCEVVDTVGVDVGCMINPDAFSGEIEICCSEVT